MRRFAVVLTVALMGALAFAVVHSSAQQSSTGLYKVLKTARVGGEVSAFR